MEGKVQPPIAMVLLLPAGPHYSTWRLPGILMEPVPDKTVSQLPQDWPSSLGEARAIQITVQGKPSDIQNALHIVLRMMEDASALRDAAGMRRSLGLAVQLTPTALAELHKHRGQRLKALCRNCPSRLRASLAGHAPPLLLLSGFPEALHAALPQVGDLLRAVVAGPVTQPDVMPAVVGDYSLWVWLKSLDGGAGQLLVYCSRLNELFQDISQLQTVQRGPNGEMPHPGFFEALGVQRDDHRDMFRRWFRERF
ncbi:unnamed protein product [Effrenium voratum]|uniref:Uncharacterized protein n=1 Tax=Effrenium voratum TaxID=2562239 RepID=A0AA36HNY1_9DINO|nr:unnamed protein product [Effrenium voratum]CAJ1371977.1 unnamed protein product [Effrenium voratum]CAJ1422280.1 unnamed protein product [Effrenium voratum]